MSHTIELVREFHAAFGLPVADTVHDLPNERRVLRVKLIAEELVELCRAWNVQLTINEYGDFKAWTPAGRDELDHVEGADALADLAYVVAGSCLEAGYPAAALDAEVHASNMSKAGVDGRPIIRADGKLLKGPNYFSPNIASVLRTAGGWKGNSDAS